ncbi:MAG: hypothetical protein M1833_003481 [Piccolia ochrophora]|nr:MAG: hypothetical protein M1833_003481 [Piccolia ochrophora]
MTSSAEATSKSGIATSDTGERLIPSSKRPDGTTRKEIKIRPGYRPPEDVEVYKNRTADAWKTRGTGGIPGATTFDDDKVEAGGKTSNKNAKRREARKKAKAAVDEKDEGQQEEGAIGAGSGQAESGAKRDVAKEEQLPSPPDGTAKEDEDAEREKKARKLHKKIRQARDLKEKKESGQNLLPEQFEKVIKINELIRQLDNLGFDAEGERKES